MNQIPEGATHVHVDYPDMFYKVEGPRLMLWNVVTKRWGESVLNVSRINSKFVKPLPAPGTTTYLTATEVLARNESHPVIRTEAGHFRCRPVSEYHYLHLNGEEL